MSARSDEYCRQLITVAKTLPIPEDQQRHAAEIAWTAAGGETQWANYANDGSSTLMKLGEGHGLSAAERAVARRSMAIPHDAVGRNLDSIGILQQRPGAGWGTPEELMQPAIAFSKFFHGAGGNRGLLAHPGWQNDEVWHAAWSVQQCGPSDVHVYKDAAAQAARDIARLWGDGASTVSIDWLDTATKGDVVAALKEAFHGQS